MRNTCTDNEVYRCRNDDCHAWFDCVEDWHDPRYNNGRVFTVSHGKQLALSPSYNPTYREQQARVDLRLQQLCIVVATLSFANTLQRKGLPLTLAKKKLLNKLKSDFGTMRIDSPTKTVSDVATTLLWQHSVDFTRSTETFLAKVAEGSQNKVVPSLLTEKAFDHLSKVEAMHLPKTRALGARELRQRYMKLTVLGQLRMDVCPESLLTKLLQRGLVTRPYNDLFPSDGPQKKGQHKYTLAADPSFLNRVIRRLESERNKLYPKAFFTSWTPWTSEESV